MRSSKELFQLVNSMSKAERIYFTKFSASHALGSKHSYIRLFKLLEKQKEKNIYDEALIKKQLAENGIVKNFEFTKNYLYKTILKTLNNFYYDSNSNNEIKNNIRYIEILYKKGLFSGCVKILDRSLKHAYKTDNYTAVIELLRWKRNLIYEGAIKGDEFTKLEETYKDEKKIIGILNNLADYTILSFRTRSLIIGINPHTPAKNIKKELDRILKHPLLKSEEMALSLQSLIYFYQVPALIHEIMGNHEKSYCCWENIIKVMEKDPDIIPGNFTNYIISIYNLLGPCLNLRKFDELEHYINKLKSLEAEYPDKIFENDKIMIFISTSIYALRMHILKGEFVSMYRRISEIEKALEEYGKKKFISEQPEIFYLAAYTCFGAGKNEEALKWINRILNNKEFIHDSILYVKSKIFSVVLHYELEDFELLEYLLNDNSIKKSKFFGRGEEIIINSVKRLMESSSRGMSLSIYSETLEQLQKDRRIAEQKKASRDEVLRFEDTSNFMSTDEIDMENWLESKITGKSFEEIVRSKNL